MAAAAAGVPAAVAAALAGALAAVLAAARPVRAAPAPASRVAAALLDQHLERGLAPSCVALRRGTPWAHGNDLQAPGDDSQPGSAPTTRRQTCIDALRAYLRMPCEPDSGDLSTPAERHACTLTGQVFNRVVDAGRPAWWCYPPECANGHEWRAGAGDRVMDAVRVRPGAGRTHARPGAPGGALPGAGLPGGLVLTTARADGQRLGRGSRACCRHAMPRAGARA